MLASGSDDQHLNIYSYQPESSTAPFFLNTTVLTGHTANIFSVKFMPHSNDRTLVSCAGDSEVRVFDIEHSRRPTNPSTSDYASSVRSRRINNFFNGMWYLSENNTNARVYKSHSDRVKRIVTESSPFLFLTCSEDGEVRQWDLRQPSSAYPAPRGGRGPIYRTGLQHDASNVPPPLISYKRYHLDLNTISCAASQPHYIALGGAHLHCFLHDRRMLGRDTLAERGQLGSSPPSSSHDDDAMSQATRCVRRFAPKGQKKMRSRNTGHITACKISNANPNEMIVSWSGDHIYSFDLIRSEDARDQTEEEGNMQEGSHSGRAKKSKNRKRKRVRAQSSTSGASSTRHHSRFRSEGHGADEDNMTFKVRYGNGTSEDIPFDSLPGASRLSDAPERAIERAREAVLNEAQKLSLRIAKGLVEIRKLLFSVEASVRETAGTPSNADPTPYTASFTSVLGYAATHLPEMDEVVRTWRYPLNPTRDDVIFQQALRRNRETSRRFVQASGTLARVLGGRLRTASGGDSPQLGLFQVIEPAPSENGMIDPTAQFQYDFLKAILLWLEGGRQAVVDGFKRSPARRHNTGRFPLLESDGEESIERTLIPYLHDLAGSEPIVNVDASRFEHDDSRILFDSQSAAVQAFSHAVKLKLEDLSDSAAAATGPAEGSETAGSRTALRALDRRAAIRFWGIKVARGILMGAGEGVNFEFVNRAFGGLRAVVEEDEEDEDDEDDGRERLQEDIDPNEQDEPITEVRLLSGSASRRHRSGSHPTGTEETEPETGRRGVNSPDSSDVWPDAEVEDGEEEEGDMGEDDDDDDDDSSDDYSDDDDLSDEDEGQLLIHRTSKNRQDVETNTPCSPRTNVYRGHCNVQTVKDVNYFGLDDEYVVSGSDCGNLFIWDRKTSNLVNILSADSDTVNVVQGERDRPTLFHDNIAVFGLSVNKFH